MSRVLAAIILVQLAVIPLKGGAQETVLPPRVRQLVDAALERTRHEVVYDGSYRALGYPGGDVPDNVGVCTDVVIRSYRALGMDLQELVHQDMTAAFGEYPRIWGLDHPDPNIDHRRVPNLQKFFARQDAELRVTSDPVDYRPGDVVTWLIPGDLPHIGIVVDRWSGDGNRPQVVHNIGTGPVLEDALFSFEITGHYRFLPASYDEALAIIQQKRMALLQQFENAGTETTRRAVLDQAGEYFVQAVAGEIFPFWYRTPWDFNGTTEVPGSGEIACGYFVTTVLRDVGASLDRRWLAQQPSEVMIGRLVGPTAIKRFSDVVFGEFVAAIREWGMGLYVVGLDLHTGFIVFDESGVRFVHSSYLEPLCVVQEEALDSAILSASRYRVLGKLTADRHFLEAWLSGTSVSSGGR